LEPIPLAHDILVKAGFKKDNNGNYWQEIEGAAHYLELIIGADEYYPIYAEMPELSSQTEQRVSTNSIQYFHQLQNLFFALAGTELTLSL
jgi:hypothetical protein